MKDIGTIKGKDEYMVSVKKTNYISILSVICCFAVVLLHTNGCFWNFSMERYWKIANIIECVFYFAVPCFFMISGATLLDYRERYSTRQYFVKRIKKTVIPFLVWSIIGLIYNIYVLKSININDVNILWVYNGIVNTSIVSIYWFFPSLFCIYLSIPLFAAVEKSSRKEVFSYLAIVGFCLNFAIPLVKNVFWANASWTISMSVVSGNLIYIVIGYLLNEYEVSKKARRNIYIMAIIGFLIHLIGTYIVSVQAGEVLRTFKGYSSAPCIMYSVGIYVWFKYNAYRLQNSKIINKAIGIILPYTFGIYLLQWFIYKGMIHFMDINVKSLVYRLGAPFFIVPFSICIIKFIKKIPILKHIVP